VLDEGGDAAVHGGVDAHIHRDGIHEGDVVAGGVADFIKDDTAKDAILDEHFLDVVVLLEAGHTVGDADFGEDKGVFGAAGLQGRGDFFQDTGDGVADLLGGQRIGVRKVALDRELPSLHDAIEPAAQGFGELRHGAKGQQVEGFRRREHRMEANNFSGSHRRANLRWR
jgi:hypothetical protein